MSVETRAQMFTATLFIITKTWKQPRCPSVGERINKLWSIKTMGYYSALKNKCATKPQETWRRL